MLAFLLLVSGCSNQEGRILNAEDNTPIAGAIIVHNGQLTQSDASGKFKLAKMDASKPMLVKANGYGRASVKVKKYIKPDARLKRITPKALFLSHAGAGAAYLRDPIMQQIAATDLNAIVVDVKGQRGLFTFSWEIPTGHKIGAFSKITIEDPDAFIRDLHAKDIYVIGRVCVFKDEALANNKTDMAVIDTKTTKAFKDSDKIPWVDPFLEEVWDYNLAIAKAAAEIGFDEIQFDYLRFPRGNIQLSKENTKDARQQVITGFLKRAQQELQPFNVFISIAVSGESLWRPEDAGMGQDIATLAPLVDYVSPYIFPSDLPANVFGFKTNSAAIPGKVVTAALERVLPLVGNDPKKLRPWLQGFKDYSRLRLEFKEAEIGAEIAACDKAGTAGWMLFNPENKYPFISGAMDKAKEAPIAPAETAQAQP